MYRVEERENTKTYERDTPNSDHAWHLRTLDQGGVGVVKLHCEECAKDTGWSVSWRTM